MRILLLATTALLVVAAPAGAQSAVEGRVGKLESEMRAVQRKVFPNGQLLQPEIEAPAPSGPIPGTPAGSALADLQARVAALEGQVSTLTGEVEQAGYRTRQLQESFDAYRRTADARWKTLEVRPVAAPAPIDDEASPGAAAPRPATRPAAPPRVGLQPPTAKPAVPATAEAAEPKPAAITRPETGDPAEDAYLYGYRLWAAKSYPEAEAALKKAATDFPKSRRYSYSQNLLGRAYLDDGKPSLASMAFYENYKKMPDGERAPESLYYLAQALQKLNKPADACKVYDELTDVYGTKISTRMKADVVSGRTAAKCK